MKKYLVLLAVLVSTSANAGFWKGAIIGAVAARATCTDPDRAVADAMQPVKDATARINKILELQTIPAKVKADLKAQVQAIQNATREH